MLGDKRWSVRYQDRVSRSTKQPYVPLCGNSQASDKRLANRRFRRVNRNAVVSDDEPMLVREVSNVCDWPQDGTRAYRPHVESATRK